MTETKLAKDPQTEAMSFETALEQLEKQVAVLESGEVSLDEAMLAFAKGTELARFCQKKLSEAERQISQLVAQQNGEVEERPFPELQ